MNVIYPKYKEALLTGVNNAPLITNTVKVLMIDTGAYTYDPNHEFKSDVTGIISESVNSIGSKTVVNGLFVGEQVLFSNVVGTTAEALIVFIDDGGDPAISRLVAYIDESTGLPLTPNGSDITAYWENGIFQL